MLCSLRHVPRGSQTVSVKCLSCEGLPVNMAMIITPYRSSVSLYDEIASQTPVANEKSGEEQTWKGITKSRVQTLSVCSQHRVRECRSRF